MTIVGVEDLKVEVDDGGGRRLRISTRNFSRTELEALEMGARNKDTMVRDHYHAISMVYGDRDVMDS
jgi:hypothetical protein